MKRLILIFGMICVLGAIPVIAQETAAEGEEEEPKWVGSLGLAWVATSGNTDTSSIGLDFGLESKPAPWSRAQACQPLGRLRWPGVGERSIRGIRLTIHCLGGCDLYRG